MFEQVHNLFNYKSYYKHYNKLTYLMFIKYFLKTYVFI